MQRFKAAWEENEYKNADFHDKRLQDRAIKLLKQFSSEPEGPINQVCLNWSDVKAAYRFFNSDKINVSALIAPHIASTLERVKQYKSILAIQDTTFFNYTGHQATSGLGNIGRRGNKTFRSSGLIMHTVFAVTQDGLPLGILDQKIFSRAQKKRKKKRSRTAYFSDPMQDLESIRWIEGLVNSNYRLEYSECKSITVCDREGDFYDLFEYAHILKASFLIRARIDRKIIGGVRNSAHYFKGEKRLWNFMKSRRLRRRMGIEIPSRGGDLGSHHRAAEVELRHARIKILPSKGLSASKKLILYAIYVCEPNPPQGEEPLEWMLITNLPVRTFDEAAEKVKWYSFRFRIETLHRILKSGFLVEQCRLGTAQSLTRYLTLMSVVAWRIFWITIIGRTSPNSPCTSFLTDSEWKVLYAKVYQTYDFPRHPISTQKAIHLIGRLGGFLDRKNDADPGVITLWRGWRRLTDLAEGWNIASAA